MLPSASALYAIATDVHAQINEQFNSQNNNSIEREIEVPGGLDVRVAIYASIRPDAVRVHCRRFGWRLPQACAVTVKRATLQGDQFQTMFGC